MANCNHKFVDANIIVSYDKQIDHVFCGRICLDCRFIPEEEETKEFCSLLSDHPYKCDTNLPTYVREITNYFRYRVFTMKEYEEYCKNNK